MAFKLDTVFIFDDKQRESLNINKIPIIGDHCEMWKYIRLDRHKELNKRRRFMISSYGRVYDTEEKRIIEIHDSSKNAQGEHYNGVRLIYGDITVTYFIHRLIMMAFVEPDSERPFVNHIDGHPSHNYLWNLEWCNTSENYIHALKTGLKIEKHGEERSNAVWTNEEIHMICKMIEEGHKATYIYLALGDILKDPKVIYERVRTLYKHIIHKTHWTQISSQYNIDFTKFNYNKEKAQVKKLNNN